MSLYGKDLQGIQGTKKDLIKTKNLLMNKNQWKIVKVPKPKWNYMGKWKPIYEFQRKRRL